MFRKQTRTNANAIDMTHEQIREQKANVVSPFLSILVLPSTLLGGMQGHRRRWMDGRTDENLQLSIRSFVECFIPPAGLNNLDE